MMKWFPAWLLLVASVSGQNADLRPAVTNSGGAAGKSRVVVLENPAVIDNFRVNDALLAQNFNRAMLALTNQPTVSEAWRLFVNPRDVVAVHVTTTGGQALSTHRALLDAVVSGLQAAGVAKRNIIVWDKYADDMATAGFVNSSGGASDYRCQSVIPGAGFDSEKFYFSDIAGQLIWGDNDFRGKPRLSVSELLAPDPLVINLSGTPAVSGTKPAEPPQVSNRSYYTKIITKRATKIINLPVLSNDERIGIAGCVSSLALASVDNTRRFLNSSDATAEAIAEIFAHDEIKLKTVLNIMDGTLAQYAGGPYFVPYYSAQPGLLYLSRDPVAIDTLALERVEAWRKAKAIDPVGKDAAHLRQAAQLGVGTNDKARMEIVNLR